MAVSTTLSQALRLIAGALTEYAKDHGWADSDYAIFYRIDSQWDRIHVVFVADEFEKQPEFANYSSVRSYLESKLKQEPDLLNYVGLVVRSSKQVKEGGIYAIGPEFREYWTINH